MGIPLLSSSAPPAHAPNSTAAVMPHATLNLIRQSPFTRHGWRSYALRHGAPMEGSIGSPRERSGRHAPASRHDAQVRRTLFSAQIEKAMEHRKASEEVSEF